MARVQSLGVQLSMALASGDRVGAYEVVALLGVVGMGEVYFEPTRAVISGDPVPVTQLVGSDLGQGRGTFSVAAAAGVLTYLSGIGGQLRQLLWRDRAGRIMGTVGQPDDTGIPSIALAPDGRRVATSRTPQGNQDVWLIDVNRGVPSRFTFDTSNDNAPAWSADGQRIVFRSVRNGPYDLFEKPASGAGDEQLLLATPEPKIAYDRRSLRPVASGRCQPAGESTLAGGPTAENYFTLRPTAA